MGLATEDCMNRGGPDQLLKHIFCLDNTAYESMMDALGHGQVGFITVGAWECECRSSSQGAHTQVWYRQLIGVVNVTIQNAADADRSGVGGQ